MSCSIDFRNHYTNRVPRLNPILRAKDVDDWKWKEPDENVNTHSRDIVQTSERKLTRKIRRQRLSRDKEEAESEERRAGRRRLCRCRIFPPFHSTFCITTVLHRVGIHFNEFAFQRQGVLSSSSRTLFHRYIGTCIGVRVNPSPWTFW